MELWWNHVEKSYRFCEKGTSTVGYTRRIEIASS